ncbi:MAG: peptidylprolyl isomerase [Planctomycetaceae bacterium]|nr:peptidylprolyl isomerase [Planctomycetaceae bacterium]
MSERTHSPEGTPQGQTVGEFTSTAPVETATSQPTKTRFTRKQKLLFVAGGTLAIAVTAVGLFQFLKQEDASAQTAGSASVQQPGQAAAAGTNRPLARVGKQTIPWQIVAEECMLRYGDEVLENIINRTIIFQACQERGVSVTKEEVDQEVSRIAKRFNLTPDNWYAMLQAERNLTPMQYRRDVIWPMLALKKLAGGNVQVTEADLQKAFESAYGERVKAKMIMMGDFRNIQKVWNEAQKDPSKFEDLAKANSIEPNSKTLGGVIPPIRRHGGNEELEKEAFRLQPGAISAVVQVGAGRWVILKCEGRTEPHVRAMTPEIRQELYNALIEEKTQESVANVFNQIKEMARVDNYLKGTVTGGNVAQTSHQQPATTPNGTYPQKAAPARNTQPQLLPGRTATGQVPGTQPSRN